MTKERYIGPFLIRDDMFEDGPVPLHQHVVPHVLQVKKGAALVEIVDGLDGPTILSRVIRSDDETDCILIEARMFHRVTLLEPETRTQCMFCELVPVVLTEQLGKDAEYDKLLNQLIVMAAEKWRVVAKDGNGWTEGTC